MDATTEESPPGLIGKSIQSMLERDQNPVLFTREGLAGLVEVLPTSRTTKGLTAEAFTREVRDYAHPDYAYEFFGGDQWSAASAENGHLEYEHGRVAPYGHLQVLLRRTGWDQVQNLHRELEAIKELAFLQGLRLGGSVEAPAIELRDEHFGESSRFSASRLSSSIPIVGKGIKAVLEAGRSKSEGRRHAASQVRELDGGAYRMMLAMNAVSLELFSQAGLVGDAVKVWREINVNTKAGDFVHQGILDDLFDQARPFTERAEGIKGFVHNELKEIREIVGGDAELGNHGAERIAGNCKYQIDEAIAKLQGQDVPGGLESIRAVGWKLERLERRDLADRLPFVHAAVHLEAVLRGPMFGVAAMACEAMSQDLEATGAEARSARTLAGPGIDVELTPSPRQGEMEDSLIAVGIDSEGRPCAVVGPESVAHGESALRVRTGSPPVTGRSKAQKYLEFAIKRGVLQREEPAENDRGGPDKTL